MNDQAMTLESATTGPSTSIFSLLHAAHVLEDKVEAALSVVGLSLPKYSVLTELVTSGASVSLSELASRLSCVRSNMTQLVDRLETDGVVKRVDDPADRRAVKAEITALGRERQAAGAAEIEKLHLVFAANVSANDQAAIERVLSVLK